LRDEDELVLELVENNLSPENTDNSSKDLLISKASTNLQASVQELKQKQTPHLSNLKLSFLILRSLKKILMMRKYRILRLSQLKSENGLRSKGSKSNKIGKKA